MPIRSFSLLRTVIKSHFKRQFIHHTHSPRDTARIGKGGVASRKLRFNRSPNYLQPSRIAPRRRIGTGTGLQQQQHQPSVRANTFLILKFQLRSHSVHENGSTIPTRPKTLASNVKGTGKRYNNCRIGGKKTHLS